MQMRHFFTLRAIVVCTLTVLGTQLPSFGQQEQEAVKKTTEPVYRVGRSTDSETTLATGTEAAEPAKEAPDANPEMAAFGRAMDIAHQGLTHIRSNVDDYTGVLIKRERINGRLSDPEFMEVKIRNRRSAENIPFSIYFKFLQPSGVKDREVIWVEGRNDNKLIAHEGGGIMSNIRATLDPEGFLAMRGNRYPIYEAGIENLVAKLIEKGDRDMQLGDAKVKFYENTKINGRTCSLIQVTHPENKAPYEFHVCRVFIDDELKIPIRYAGYSWPKEEGGKPVLEEEYTYINMKLNVGLTERDFDPENPKYAFP